MNVILYYSNYEKCFKLDKAIPYFLIEKYENKTESRGFNIFGQSLDELLGPIERVIFKERIKFKCGENIKNFKTITEANNFIRKNKLNQILNIH